MDCSFSKCNVNKRPEEFGLCSDSNDEKLDEKLSKATPCPMRPGDTDREAAAELAFVPLVCRRLPRRSSLSSAEERVGEERAGDMEIRSSASDTWPLSNDAAKLLEKSGSEMYA